ncbi:50S ribosome-binding GTPase (macronuclear) [Tetrahymena thermophila SB210]|uniref:Mitochondrial GTPase 1 n=1 Tax=Tetrahymena thermophila (strain SB210) TaxID=312017 RepID=W7XHL4_TETTS|nr:50S ribosome-binding GTPase [Tetrahymena thermophila SB210]EWS73886.1 50S ribosome-binding GTPase [Tetrahymena thermophila SB210]|eukprot:XP_012653633.1 50S ribosome-binding GTPase [Tetrahymena thermophila SB210]
MKAIADTFPALGEKVNWFPGHMYRALRLMKENVDKIDCFLEIRDSRVPISSRNQEFDDLCSFHSKKKIIIFNKYDLSNQRVMNNVIEKYNRVGIDCFAVSAKKGTNMKDIITQLQQRMPAKYDTVGTWLMICGMPNVGKSTIINQIRQIAPELHNRRAINKATATPCTTKSVVGVKFSQKPLAYLVDTPGVMIPNIQDDETALKLSLVGCIKDVIPGKEPILDYLVWILNKQKQQTYQHYYGMKEPAKTGDELFVHVRDKFNHYNYDTTYDFILDDFRTGKLGRITMDTIDF